MVDCAHDLEALMNRELAQREITRRDFLTRVAFAGGATLLGLASAAESQTMAATGVVVRYTDPKFGGDDYDVNRAARAVDESVCALFKAKKAEAVWSRLFDPSDVVVIKVNCLGGANLSTRPGLVEAIVQRLTSARVKPDNIYVFDWNGRHLVKAGFTLNQQPGKPCVAGPEMIGGYEEALTQFGAIASKLAKVITTTCTAIINVPILKDHRIVGVTGAMKNYFGVIDNPSKYHPGRGEPHVAHLYAMPIIRGKERLTICDCLSASFEGGPMYVPSGVWRPSCLLVATDAVALDYVGWGMIEAERQKHGLQPLANEGRSPRYIFTAASLGLGVKSPQSSRIIDLVAAT